MNTSKAITQKIREARQNESGFTLIELLIVIIVLGILAAVVLFALGTFKSDSASAACKTDGKDVETAETAYFAKHNAYVPITATAPAPSLVSAGYLKSAPSTANYTITVDTSTGAVSGSLAGGGGTCY
ncbi:MAG: type II secretion system protein [Actinomycetes bacterium]